MLRLRFVFHVFFKEKKSLTWVCEKGFIWESFCATAREIQTLILVKQLHAKMVIYKALNGRSEQVERRPLSHRCDTLVTSFCNPFSILLCPTKLVSCGRKSSRSLWEHNRFLDSGEESKSPCYDAIRNVLVSL